MQFFLSLLILFAFFPLLAAAQETPLLFFPLDCKLGENCWPVQYMDADPAQGAAKDFACGFKTADDLKGTVYGLKDYAGLEKGVDVLAAAAGKVVRARDGEPDGVKTPEELEAIRAAKKDCGNAVLIDHGDGLQTLYCHLKNGSLVVKPGDNVTAAQKIAQVGQSGAAEFPRLHFGLVRGSEIIDPYSGKTADGSCGDSAKPLWSPGLQNMEYDPLTPFAAEFASGKPDFDAIQKDATPVAISKEAKSLSFWVGIYGAAQGDGVSLEIFDPAGKSFARKDYVQKEDRARQYYYTGREDVPSLEAGIYKARASVRRNGREKTLDREIKVR